MNGPRDFRSGSAPLRSSASAPRTMPAVHCSDGSFKATIQRLSSCTHKLALCAPESSPKVRENSTHQREAASLRVSPLHFAIEDYASLSFAGISVSALHSNDQQLRDCPSVLSKSL